MKMTTRNIPGGKGGRCVRLRTYHHTVPLSRNLGALTSQKPLDLFRPVTGQLLHINIILPSSPLSSSWFVCKVFTDRIIYPCPPSIRGFRYNTQGRRVILIKEIEVRDRQTDGRPSNVL